MVMMPAINSLVFHDSYRFQMHSLDGEHSIPTELQKLRKSDDLVYIRVYSDLMILITKSSSGLRFYQYLPQTNELQDLPLPDSLVERIRIPKVKNGLSNKMKGGKPKFLTLNTESNFDIVQTKIGFIYSSKTEGVYLYREGKEIPIVSETFDSMALAEASSSVLIQTLNICFESGKVRLTNYVLHLNERGQILRKTANASFTASDLIGTKNMLSSSQGSQFTQVMHHVLAAKSAVSIIGVNIGERFCLCMVDVFSSQTVIDLTARVSNSLLDSTRYSHIERIQFCSDLGSFLVSMSNGNLMVFDQNGSQVRVISEKLFNEGVLQNRQMFIEDFQHQVNPGSQKYRALNIVANFGSYFAFFNGFKAHFFAVKVKRVKTPEQSPARSLDIYTAFPVVMNSGEVLLADDVFLNPVRTYSNFVHLLRAEPLSESSRPWDTLRKHLFIATNVINFLLMQNQTELAFSTLLLVREEAYFPTNQSQQLDKDASMFKKTKAVEILTGGGQSFKQFNYTVISQETEKQITYQSKGSMFNRWFWVIILRVLAKIRQDSKLNPQLIKKLGISYPMLRVQAYSLIRRSLAEAFSGNKSVMRADFVQLIRELIESAKSDPELKELLKVDHQQSERKDGQLAWTKNIYQAVRVKKLVRKNFMSRQMFLLLQSEEKQRYTKSIQIFKENINQISGADLYLMVQVYLKFQENLAFRKDAKVMASTVLLPTYLAIMPLVKSDYQLLELDQVKTQGHQVFLLPSKSKLVDPLLKYSLMAYMGQPIDLSQMIQGLKPQDLLFIARIQQEGGNQLYFTDQSKIFPLLSHWVSNDELAIRQGLAILTLLTEWGTLDIRSNSATMIWDVVSAQFKARQHQVVYQEVNQAPKFFNYMIQNINRLTLAQLQECKRVKIPLCQQKLKLNNFMFESLIHMASAFKIGFDYNLHTLLNAANMQCGLSQIMKFKEFEDKTHQLMYTNQMSARDKIEIDGQLEKTKVAIWKVVIFLWWYQCSFRALNAPSELERIKNSIRSFHISSSLGFSSSHIDYEKVLHQSRELPELSQLIEVYQGMKRDTQVDYIGRILLDNDLNKFITKLTKIIHTYSKQSSEKLKTQVLKTEDLVRVLYNQQYAKLRELFGLKLTYSLQIDKQNQEIRLIKRAKKAWFKNLNANNQKLVLEESKKIDMLDKSYLSLKEDQLNKSALLDITQPIVKEPEDEKRLQLEEKQLGTTQQISLDYKPDLLSDDFSRASSRGQEEIRVPVEELFKQRKAETQQISTSIKEIPIDMPDDMELKRKTYEGRLELGMEKVRQIIWKKNTQAQYQFLYRIQLIDELSKSQERLKSKYKARYSTIDHQDSSTNFDNDSNQIMTTQTERPDRMGKSHRRYETPQGPGQVTKPLRYKSGSPEQDNETRMKLFDYSPIILDDASDGQESMNFGESNQSTIQMHMDTSRFAVGLNQQTYSDAPDRTYRSNISTLTHFIDPEQHFKGLKSPYRNKRSQSPQTPEGTSVADNSTYRTTDRTQQSKPITQRALYQTMIEKSPVHFGNASKYDHLNNSKVLKDVPLLGTQFYRKMSRGVIGQDGKTSPKTLKFMLLKPQMTGMPLQNTVDIPQLAQQTSLKNTKAKFILFPKQSR